MLKAHGFIAKKGNAKDLIRRMQSMGVRVRRPSEAPTP